MPRPATSMEGVFALATKRCSKCGEPKDRSAFSKQSQKKDGLRPNCKACDAAYNTAHREDRIAYNTARREERATYDANWRKAHPNKCRAYTNKHRSLKAGNGGTHTAADVQHQGDSQHWQCWWRGPDCAVDCRDKYDVDHLVPLSRGGHNDPSNIVISCPHCNRSKQDKLPEEFCGRLL